MLEGDKDNILSRKLIFFRLFCSFSIIILSSLFFCVFMRYAWLTVSVPKANCKNFAIFFFCWLNLWLDFRPISTLDLIRFFVVVIIKRERVRSQSTNTVYSSHIWKAIEWLLPLFRSIWRWVFAAWQECDFAICCWPRAWNNPSTEAISIAGRTRLYRWIRTQNLNLSVVDGKTVSIVIYIYTRIHSNKQNHFSADKW